jgi:hypothetical protein
VVTNLQPNQEVHLDAEGCQHYRIALALGVGLHQWRHSYIHQQDKELAYETDSSWPLPQSFE